MELWQRLFWLVVLIVLGIANYKLTYRLCTAHLNKRSDALLSYVKTAFSHTYFCGYNLWDIHLSQFFPRFGSSIDWGFCASVGAMSMLALKDNPTARYMFASDKEGRGIHVWVEFRYQRHTYVVDPCWFTPFIVSKRQHRKATRLQVFKIVDYRTFWSYPISEQFYQKMQRPETSWLIWELITTYCFYEQPDGQVNVFPRDIASQQLDPDDGEHISLALFYDHPEILFSRRVMHDMMQRPQREQLKARSVRQVKRLQKIIAARFDEWLREHPEHSESPEPAQAS